MVAVCFQLREREIDHGYHKVPARVGVFVAVEQLSSKDWTYPHARGGVRRRESFRPLAPSLSPRMWG